LYEEEVDRNHCPLYQLFRNRGTALSFVAEEAGGDETLCCKTKNSPYMMCEAPVGFSPGDLISLNYFLSKGVRRRVSKL